MSGAVPLTLRYLQVRNALAGLCTHSLGRYGICGYQDGHELHRPAVECTEEPKCATPWAHHTFTTEVPPA